MSARTGKGDSLDRYYTPHWAVSQGLAEVVIPRIRNPATIWEPSAGYGAFLRPLRTAYPSAQIRASDLDIFPPGATFAPIEYMHADAWAFGVDFLTRDPFARCVYDLIIGNPPFRHALEFCEMALQRSRAVCFLLRQGFLASGKRADFFRRHPPTTIGMLPNRPSFTRDGRTDSADYCWVLWEQNCPPHGTDVQWLSNVPPSERGPAIFPKKQHSLELRTAALVKGGYVG